jgi:hypothetical protein
LTGTLDKLAVVKTDSLPQVVLDSDSGVFEIIGHSLPQNGKAFYDPILSWIDAYAHHPNGHTHFAFDLESFNIYSAKMILFILYALKKIQDNGKEVKILWYYDDEGDEMYESGRDYEIMVKLPFIFLKGQKM